MLVLSVLLILCSNAVTIRRDKSVLYARSVIIVMICCLIINYNNFYLEFLNNGIGLYHGLLHISSISHFFHLFIFFICSFILLLNSFYPRKVWKDEFSSIYKLLAYKLVYFNSFILNKMAEQFRILEYPLIILFVITGGVFLITCSDLISLFLAIELQSYGLYILCSIYRESERATSAGLTYFLLGGLSSCFILFASGLIYSNSGNTSFDGIYVINNISYANEFSLSSPYNIIYQLDYINLALAIMSVGFLFKVTAAPFHFWSPDVYDAIPTVVTTFVAIFAKVSIFILVLELVYYTNNIDVLQLNTGTGNTLLNSSWKFTLLLSAFLSFIIGSILGMTQSRIKRLYAYSTISHVGFILLALTVNSIESIQAFMFYLMQYSLSNLNAFVILIAIGYSLYVYIENQTESDLSNNNKLTPIISDKKNSPIQLISQLTGFFNINPALAISLGVTIFSFVGVPPLIGFFGKQMVLSSALDNGYVFMSLVAILTSVISAYYYLSLVKQIFFHNTDYIKNPQVDNLSIKGNIVDSNNNNNTININVNKDIVLSSSLSVVISIITLMMLLFILSPQEWLSMINILSLTLFNS